MAAQDSDVSQVMSMVYALLEVPEIQQNIERERAKGVVTEMRRTVQEYVRQLHSAEEECGSQVGKRVREMVRESQIQMLELREWLHMLHKKISQP